MTLSETLAQIPWYYWAMAVAAVILVLIVVITSARYHGPPRNVIEPYTRLPPALQTVVNAGGGSAEV